MALICDNTDYGTDTAGAALNLEPHQIVTYSGYAVGATAVVGSVGVLTVVAPAQMALAAGVATGCIVAGSRMADGLPIIPRFGQDADKADKPATSDKTPAPAAA